MKNSILFNWPSGASGDFILVIRELLLGTDVVMEYTPKYNRFGMNTESLGNVYRPFTTHDFNYESVKYNHMIHCHTLGDGLDVPDNVVIVNIDNEYTEMYTSLLYFLKQEEQILNDEDNFLFLESSKDCKKFYKNRQNYYNFKYSDIFIDCNLNEIARLYSVLGIELEDNASVVYKCFKIYSQINVDILDMFSINLANNKSYIRGEKYKIESLEHLLKMLSERLSSNMEIT